MICPFVFVRETSDLSLVSMDPCSIHHSVYFRCDYFPCFDASWPSLTFLSLRLLLSYFIPPFHSTSSYLILFLSCLMFDMSSASALHACLFDVTIHLSSLFVWGPLSPGLVTFSTHCISCTRGMGDYIIGIFEPSFLSFLSPYYLGLRYVLCLKTTLRPLLHALCLTAHTWAILEISRRLFLGAWWMRGRGDRLH